MIDLTKLTAEELMDVFRASAFGVNEWAEIRRRLEELAVLKDLYAASEILRQDMVKADVEHLKTFQKVKEELEQLKAVSRAKAIEDLHRTSAELIVREELLERLEKCEAVCQRLSAITSEDCSCLPAFKERGLVDPTCSYHDYKWAIDAARAAVEE